MMSRSTAERRQLEFSSLEQISQEIERLHRDGYEPIGHWDLGQSCAHIADWMEFPMDGFPRGPVPVRALLWLMKVAMGKRQLKKILATRSMPAGSPTLRETVHKETHEDAEQVQRLLSVVERLQRSSGPYFASPLFGEMDRDTVVQLQLIHAAHHLSFLRPKATEA